MAALTIRNIPAETQQALRELAAANGRSMEAEVRAILDAEIGRRKWLTDQEREIFNSEQQAALARLRQAFAPLNESERGKGVDSFLAERASLWDNR